eukprot:scaffold102069_cov59-Phaeocystis_antarctica.AAC.2
MSAARVAAETAAARVAVWRAVAGLVAAKAMATAAMSAARAAAETAAARVTVGRAVAGSVAARAVATEATALAVCGEGPAALRAVPPASVRASLLDERLLVGENRATIRLVADACDCAGAWPDCSLLSVTRLNGVPAQGESPAPPWCQKRAGNGGEPCDEVCRTERVV